jgi:hypothetical protein
MPDIFNVCRLLFQALGGLRNAVPDGQHRLAGMVRVLFGFEIVTESREQPPRSFRYEETHFGIFTGSSEEGLEEVDNGPSQNDSTTLMSAVLSKLSNTAVVRIVVPTVTSRFEIESERFSRVRTESLSHVKPRVLSDA